MKRSTKRTLRTAGVIALICLAFFVGTIVGRRLVPDDEQTSGSYESVTLADHNEPETAAVPDATEQDTSVPEMAVPDAAADHPAEDDSGVPIQTEQSTPSDTWDMPSVTVDFEELKFTSIEKLFGSKKDMHNMMPYADLLAFIAEVPGTSDFEYYLCPDENAVKATFVYNGETITAYAVRSDSLVSPNRMLEPAYSITKTEGVTAVSVDIFSDGSISGYYNRQLGLSVFIFSSDHELIQKTIV